MFYSYFSFLQQKSPISCIIGDVRVPCAYVTNFFDFVSSFILSSIYANCFKFRYKKTSYNINVSHQFITLFLEIFDKIILIPTYIFNFYFFSQTKQKMNFNINITLYSS